MSAVTVMTGLKAMGNAFSEDHAALLWGKRTRKSLAMVGTSNHADLGKPMNLVVGKPVATSDMKLIVHIDTKIAHAFPGVDSHARGAQYFAQWQTLNGPGGISAIRSNWNDTLTYDWWRDGS